MQRATWITRSGPLARWSFPFRRSSSIPLFECSDRARARIPIVVPFLMDIPFQADKGVRRHAQTTAITTTDTTQLTTTTQSTTTTSQLKKSARWRRAARPAAEALARLSPLPVKQSASPSHLLHASPTATRRISTGSTLHHGPAGGVTRPSSPDEGRDAGPESHASLERGTISSAAAATSASGASSVAASKKRKMPIINPLVTLPMWPSKCRVNSSALVTLV